jgi:hypothetical protein
MGSGNRRTGRGPRLLQASALALSIFVAGCSSTEPFTEEDRRTNVEVECRARAEQGGRPRQPTANLQNSIYRQCMQERGYPNR